MSTSARASLRPSAPDRLHAVFLALLPKRGAVLAALLAHDVAPAYERPFYRPYEQARFLLRRCFHVPARS